MLTITRPPMMMVRVLAWTAPLMWAASVPVAAEGTGRELMWLLAGAGMGTCCALVLLAVGWMERAWQQRSAEYRQLERELCGVIREELRPGVAMTRPDLRVVPQVLDLRAVRLGGRRGGAQARR